MEIIVFIIVVSILFPGSSGGGSFDLMMIPVFIICVALVLGFIAAITYAAVFVFEMTENGWFGVATWLALFFGSLLTNKWLAERSDRRRAWKCGWFRVCK